MFNSTLFAKLRNPERLKFKLLLDDFELSVGATSILMPIMDIEEIPESTEEEIITKVTTRKVKSKNSLF